MGSFLLARAFEFENPLTLKLKVGSSKLNSFYLKSNLNFE